MSKFFKKVFKNLPTRVTICDGSTPVIPGWKPKKQQLHFGCNYQDLPTIVIEWTDKCRGFGEYTFQINKQGLLECRSELDDRETVKRMLCTMVDQCIFTEVDNPKERAPKCKLKAKSNSKSKSQTKK